MGASVPVQKVKHWTQHPQAQKRFYLLQGAEENLKFWEINFTSSIHLILKDEVVLIIMGATSGGVGFQTAGSTEEVAC